VRTPDAPSSTAEDGVHKQHETLPPDVVRREGPGCAIRERWW
jgi:hypothetical protein